LIVSGKPVVALVPWFIVGFEFTVLFAVFGNVLGLISQARLPRFESPPDYEERFSGDRFGVLARCQADEKDELTRFFKENGAEIKTTDG
jgi:molybdopterin-containing oxidoreductase family membrane subunit